MSFSICYLSRPYLET